MQLTWKAYMRAQVKKGLRALSCNAFINRTWGFLPKMALWLNKHVIIPKITYAAVTCGTKWTLLWQSQSWKVCRRPHVGAMRTTPTKVLELLLELLTLRTLMDSAVLMAAYCLPGPDPRNLGIGHDQIRAKADKVDNKFSMIKDLVTLRSTFGKSQIVIPIESVGEKLVQSAEKKACLVYRWSL